MSCQEYKTVIRARVPLRTKDKHKAYLFFKDKLGEPTEVDYSDKENTIVDYFDYDSSCKFVPIIDYYEHEYQYYVDYIIKHNYGYSEKIDRGNLSISEVYKISQELAILFNIDIDQDIKQISYDWYNGTDEPADFD